MEISSNLKTIYLIIISVIRALINYFRIIFSNPEIPVTSFSTLVQKKSVVTDSRVDLIETETFSAKESFQSS